MRLVVFVAILAMLLVVGCMTERTTRPESAWRQTTVYDQGGKPVTTTRESTAVGVSYKGKNAAEMDIGGTKATPDKAEAGESEADWHAPATSITGIVIVAALLIAGGGILWYMVGFGIGAPVVGAGVFVLASVLQPWLLAAAGLMILVGVGYVVYKAFKGTQASVALNAIVPEVEALPTIVKRVLTLLGVQGANPDTVAEAVTDELKDNIAKKAGSEAATVKATVTAVKTT